MASICARHYQTAAAVRLTWSGASIAELAPQDDGSCPAASFVAPGFIDLQVNGFAGIDFGAADVSVEKIRTATLRLWETGTTHFLPTLITNSIERFEHSLVVLRRAAAEPDLAPAILGFHLEGPYISAEDGPRGAHPRQHCKDPDWDECRRLQDAAGGMIRLVTLAPERPGAIRFIEQAVAAGMRVAIGHTAADRPQILDAIAAGATLSTHLGNGAHDRLQRHHNYIYDQLADDRLQASLIVDGHHLPETVVRIFLRAKGIERTILISDAVCYAGLPPGVYDAGHCQIEVRPDGFVGVHGQPRLAGSGMPQVRGVENLVGFTGIALAEAIRTAAANPAAYLGFDDRLGALAPGREASFVLFDWDGARRRIAVRQTVVAGSPKLSPEGRVP